MMCNKCVELDKRHPRITNELAGCSITSGLMTLEIGILMINI